MGSGIAMTTQPNQEDPKLQARVRRLKERAKLMANVKEAPFIQVLERWLEDPKPKQSDEQP